MTFLEGLKIIKYPLVRQCEKTDCDSPFLLTILKYYGCNISFPVICEMMNTIIYNYMLY